MPRTATGDFDAMVFAMSNAARTTSAREPGTTLDTSPIFSASAAEKVAAVYAYSWTRLRLPASLGRRAKVPMSDVNPTSTSCVEDQRACFISAAFGDGTLIDNFVSSAARRMSQAVIMSTARPNDTPCTAAITGNGQRSGAPMARWKVPMCSRSCSALLAGSS